MRLGPEYIYPFGDCVYIKLGPEYVRDTGRGIYGVGAGISIRLGLCMYQTGVGVSRGYGLV